LLVLTKKDLEDLLINFPDIKRKMMAIATEKQKYHQRMTQELIKKYKNEDISGIKDLEKKTDGSSLAYKVLYQYNLSTCIETKTNYHQEEDRKFVE
jgi:hypothetical protein